MDQTQFMQICESAAHALNIEPAADENGRYSFSIDEIEVLLDFDKEDEFDRIFFYVDLGDVGPHDRARTCEQLLELNLREHGSGAYAFDIDSARVIFCGQILDGDIMTGKYVVAILRHHIEQMDDVRRMILNPAIYAEFSLNKVHNAFITATLA